MSSTNKTTHYELSQYIGTDKPTYLGDYNSDMLTIDTAIYTASENASTAVSTANSAASAASNAATAASAASTTANNAADKAELAKTTAETASTNASAALTAAQGAQTAASANTITNLAPAYDPTLTYAVDDLVTYIDGQGSGKLYKCIVAVETPEAFNINKWDDITASDCFSTIGEILNEINSTVGDTWEAILTALFNNFNGSSVDPNFEYLINLTSENAHEIFRMDFSAISGIAVRFTADTSYLAVNGNYTDSKVCVGIGVDSNDDARIYRFTCTSTFTTIGSSTPTMSITDEISTATLRSYNLKLIRKRIV